MHIKLFKNPIGIIGLLILLGLCYLGFAATSAYYLDHSRMELQVPANMHTVSGVIKVSSNSAQKIRLRVLPKLWQLNPDGVLVYQDAPLTGFNLLDNIGVNPREFDLLPGRSRLVRFLVKTPEQMQTAEYPFQLYFEPVNLLEGGNTSESTGVSHVLDVIPVFTTTVYVYQGNPMPDIKVEKFNCAYQPKNAHFDVDLDLKNEGTKHARLFGNLVLSAEDGPNAHTPLDVLHMQNSTLIIVFPNAQRLVKNSLSPTIPLTLKPGSYQLQLRLMDERNIQPAIQSTCHLKVETSMKN